MLYVICLLYFTRFQYLFASELELGGKTIVYEEDFEENVGFNWKYDKNNLTVVTDENTLQMTYKAGKIKKDGIHVSQKFHVPESMDYFFQMDIKLSSNFQWTHGGKLPGMCGGTCTTGCVDVDPDGWSARYMWRENATLTLYLYDQERINRCGDDYLILENTPKDEWINLKQYIQINDPGVNNGVVKVWINDEISLYRNDVQLIGNEQSVPLRKQKQMDKSLHRSEYINHLYFSTFFGGKSRSEFAPTEDVQIYFDNLMVYRYASTSSSGSNLSKNNNNNTEMKEDKNDEYDSRRDLGISSVDMKAPMMPRVNKTTQGNNSIVSSDTISQSLIVMVGAIILAVLLLYHLVARYTMNNNDCDILCLTARAVVRKISTHEKEKDDA